MTVTREEGDSEATFAVLMIVLSLLVFLAVRKSERRGSE